MSWQASKYAREVLEAGVDLTTAQRCVLMLLAERAGTRTNTARGGTWLAVSSGLAEGTIRRAIWALNDAGIGRVESTPPRALAFEFPLAPTLSTTRAPATGYAAVDPTASDRVPAHQRPGTRAPATAVPQRQVVNPTPHSTTCQCDGTGWIAVEDLVVNGRTSSRVAPCSGR